MSAGFEILNEVVPNQVLVAFGDVDQTARAIAAIQAEGICWAASLRGRVAWRCAYR